MLTIDVLQHIYDYQNSKGKKIELQYYANQSLVKRKTLCQLVYLRNIVVKMK